MQKNFIVFLLVLLILTSSGGLALKDARHSVVLQWMGYKVAAAGGFKEPLEKYAEHHGELCLSL